MPHYYFHVRNGTGTTFDYEGQELGDLAEARMVALNGIRSILAEELVSGTLDLDGTLNVADKDGVTLQTVRFGDAVSIVYAPAG